MMRAFVSGRFTPPLSSPEEVQALAQRRAGVATALDAMYAVAQEKLQQRADASKGWLHFGGEVDAAQEKQHLDSLFAKAKISLEQGEVLGPLALLGSSELNAAEMRLAAELNSNPLMRKLDSLGRERVQASRSRGLANMARELSLKSMELPQSAEYLAQLLEKDPYAAKSAAETLAMIHGTGGVGLTVGYFLPRLPQEVAKPSMLGGMVVAPFAGVAFEMTGLRAASWFWRGERLGAASRLGAAFVGRVGQAGAFTLLHHTVASATRDPARVWANTGSELASSVLMFNAMHLAGGAKTWITARMAEGAMNVSLLPQLGAASGLTATGRFLSGVLDHGGAILAMQGSGSVSQWMGFSPDDVKLVDTVIQHGQARMGGIFAQGVTRGRLQGALAELTTRLAMTSLPIGDPRPVPNNPLANFRFGGQAIRSANPSNFPRGWGNPSLAARGGLAGPTNPLAFLAANGGRIDFGRAPIVSRQTSQSLTEESATEPKSTAPGERRSLFQNPLFASLSTSLGGAVAFLTPELASAQAKFSLETQHAPTGPMIAGAIIIGGLVGAGWLTRKIISEPPTSFRRYWVRKIDAWRDAIPGAEPLKLGEQLERIGQSLSETQDCRQFRDKEIAEAGLRYIQEALPRLEAKDQLAGLLKVSDVLLKGGEPLAPLALEILVDNAKWLDKTGRAELAKELRDHFGYDPNMPKQEKFLNAGLALILLLPHLEVKDQLLVAKKIVEYLKDDNARAEREAKKFKEIPKNDNKLENDNKKEKEEIYGVWDAYLRLIWQEKGVLEDLPKLMQELKDNRINKLDERWDKVRDGMKWVKAKFRLPRRLEDWLNSRYRRKVDEARQREPDDEEVLNALPKKLKRDEIYVNRIEDILNFTDKMRVYRRRVGDQDAVGGSSPGTQTLRQRLEDLKWYTVGGEEWIPMLQTRHLISLLEAHIQELGNPTQP